VRHCRAATGIQVSERPIDQASAHHDDQGAVGALRDQRYRLGLEDVWRLVWGQHSTGENRINMNPNPAAPIMPHSPSSAHYNVASSPFHTTRIAVVLSANYGTIGNGCLHIASVFSNTSGVPNITMFACIEPWSSSLRRLSTAGVSPTPRAPAPHSSPLPATAPTAGGGPGSATDNARAQQQGRVRQMCLH